MELLIDLVALKSPKKVEVNVLKLSKKVLQKKNKLESLKKEGKVTLNTNPLNSKYEICITCKKRCVNEFKLQLKASMIHAS